ncbi:MAG: RNA-binding protein [Flavobacteriaceae bacterium]|nr:RNA-binding protein [Flavobacteriaceae bacterium]
MNIFVTNLNYSTKEQQVRELFEDFGEVNSVKIITDRMSGRSKGFGFVEMPDDSQALNAIENLNESELEMRNIVVKQAEDKPRSSNNNRFSNDRNYRREY